MSDSPLEELERLNAEYSAAVKEGSHDALGLWDMLRDKMMEHADWLLSRARDAERDREDAERYRWLRDKAPHATPPAPYVSRNCGDECLEGPELDAAIDAARTQE